MSLYRDYLKVNKAVARAVFDDRRGRTVSRVVGTGIADATGMKQQAGVDLFHALLVGGGLGLLAFAARKSDG